MKTPTQIYPLLALILSLYLMLTGCAVLLVGAAGAGAGTLAYMNGELKRDYEVGYDRAVQACSDALNNLQIPVNEKTADALQTIFNAKRPDGTPVILKAVKRDEQVTEVSVRTGILGVWDKNVSMQIHERIHREMDQTQQPTPVVSENTPAEELAADQNNTNAAPEEAEVIETAPSSAENKIEAAGQNNLQAKLADDFPFAERKIIIQFQHNSNEIPADAYYTLNRIAEYMIRNAKTRIQIKGYTDSHGAYSYNIMISEQRANTIKNYLIAKGVKPPHMTALGLGPQDFVAGNDSEEGRRLNRRVEIEFSWEQ